MSGLGHCGNIVGGLRSLWQHYVSLGRCGNIKFGQSVCFATLSWVSVGTIYIYNWRHRDSD